MILALILSVMNAQAVDTRTCPMAFTAQYFDMTSFEFADFCEDCEPIDLSKVPQGTFRKNLPGLKVTFGLQQAKSAKCDYELTKVECENCTDDESVYGLNPYHARIQGPQHSPELRLKLSMVNHSNQERALFFVKTDLKVLSKNRMEPATSKSSEGWVRERKTSVTAHFTGGAYPPVGWFEHASFIVQE